MIKTKSNKKEESDEEFTRRISGLMTSAKEKTKKEWAELSNTKEVQEARAQGEKWGDKMKEIAQCLEIQKEFERDPPIQNTIHINGMLASIMYEEKYQKKVELLKKNFMSFLTAGNDESYWCATYSTFGEVFLKRGGTMIQLPRSSVELPIIIKDGDIIITRDNSYVTDLVDNEEAEDQIKLFMFPNSEARLSVKEKVTIPGAAFMNPSSVPEAVKRKSKSVVHKFRVENIELVKGLFQVTIDKSLSSSNKDANKYITIPNVKFRGAAENFAEMIGSAMPKVTAEMKSKNPKMVEILEAQSRMRNLTAQKESGKTCSRLNFYAEITDSTKVIFGTMDRLIINGKPIEIKSIIQPKYTILGGKVYVTDCLKNPDPRVKGIMDRAYSFVNYAAILESKKSFMNSPGAINAEKANENLKLAKKIGDKLLIKIAENKVIATENEIAREKAYKESFSQAGLKKKKEEAEGMLAAAEETGDKELIEVAKQQVNAAVQPEDTISNRQLEETRKMLDKMEVEFGLKVKRGLPSYNSPSESEIV